MNLIHRTQWTGIDGAPSTQSLIIHTPLPNERVGVGLSLINDEIGPVNSIRANLSYAYRIPVGKGRLSIGLQGGIMNWRADFNKLNLEQTGGDEAFEELTPSHLLPNFGAGIYYFTSKFYVGFASPQLIEYDLRDNQINTPILGKTTTALFSFCRSCHSNKRRCIGFQAIHIG